MIQKLLVEYDPISNTVSVKENDFTTFELFGILVAVKAMASHDWFNKEDEDDVR